MKKKRKKWDTPAFRKKLNAQLKIIGDNLFALRKSRDESLETVGKAVKISPGYLSQMEKGLKPHFRLTRLGALAKYYDVCMRDIVSKEFLKTIKPENKKNQK